MKKFTARRIHAAIQPTLKRSSFWQPESYDRIIRDLDELAAYRRHIANNPLKSKLREGEYHHHICDWLP